MIGNTPHNSPLKKAEKRGAAKALIKIGAR
jgi:hypothetical protein